MKKLTLLLLLAAFGISTQAQTLVSVAPWLFVGKSTTVNLLVLNGAVPLNSYQFAFSPPASSFQTAQMPPNSCPVDVFYIPGFSRAVLAPDAGITTNFLIGTPGAPLETTSYDTGPSSVSNSRCTVWDVYHGSSIAVVNGTDLAISLRIDFNDVTYAGVKNLFWTFIVNGSPGPAWTGPMVVAGNTVAYYVGLPGGKQNTDTPTTILGNIDDYPSDPATQANYMNGTPPRALQGKLFLPGDILNITAVGPPNVPVAIADTYNGVSTGNPVTLGYTDSSGNFSWGPANMVYWEVGNWTGQFFIGGTPLAPFSFVVAPLVTFINGTNPSSPLAYRVGDLCTQQVLGPPNVSVYQYATFNGVPTNGGAGVRLGTTDGNGNFAAGPFPMLSQYVGTWVATYYVGDGGAQVVAPPVTFTVQ